MGNCLLGSCLVEIFRIGKLSREKLSNEKKSTENVSLGRCLHGKLSTGKMSDDQLTQVGLQKMVATSEFFPVSPETFHLYQQEKFSKKHQHINASWLGTVETIARNEPTAVAVLNPQGQSLTYSQVQHESNNLAHYFLAKISNRKRDSFNGDIVIALALSKTNIHVVSLFLAALKIGSFAYFVEEQLGMTVNSHRMEQIAPDLIVVDTENLDLSQHISDVTQINIDDESVKKVLERTNLMQKEDSEMDDRRDKGGYIIYSSGSTGKPKLSYLTTSFMSNIAQSCKNLERRGRALQISRRCFDAVLLEIIVAIGHGATLVLVDQATLLDPDLFERFINEYAITWLLITPSHISRLLQRTASLPTVETMLVGGEVLTQGLIQRIAASGVHRVVHAYGPSECGVLAMLTEMYNSKATAHVNDIVHLGHAIIGTNVRVTRFEEETDKWELCSFGEQGELVVCNSLTKVYKDDQLNEMKYVNLQDPITGDVECFYRTGDIVKITEKGDIVFVGRIDNQVKILGQLVVTDEIQDHFERAACALFPNENIQVYINVQQDLGGKPIGFNAYHTAKSQVNAQQIAKSCSESLKNTLPNYMLPKHYSWLPEFNLKAGGKLDTKHVISNAKPSFEDNTRTSLQNDVEMKVADIWTELLAVERTWTREDKFRDFGGDSLATIAMYACINKLFNVQLKSADYAKGNDSIAMISSDIHVQISLKSGGIHQVNATDNEPEILLSADEVDSLIPLHVSSTNAYTLYIIHPGDGHVRVYQKMVDKLPDSYSVYGFRAPGSEYGEEIANLSIEEYGRRYGRRIIEQHKVDGNAINMFAFCGGGAICIEIARFLQNEHYNICSLTMCDPPNPYHIEANNDTACWLATYFNGVYDLSIDAHQVRKEANSRSRQFSQQFSHQFDICFEELAACVSDEDVFTDQQYRSALKTKLRNVERHGHKIDDMKLFDIMLVAELDRMIFNNKSQHDDLRQFTTYMEKIEYFVKFGHEKNIIPRHVGIPFFIRLLEMCRQMFSSIFKYTPTPLHLVGGNITYCTTSPNPDQICPYYPHFETWRDFIPQAMTHRFRGFDHYSLLTDPIGAELLATFIQLKVEQT